MSCDYIDNVTVLIIISIILWSWWRAASTVIHLRLLVRMKRASTSLVTAGQRAVIWTEPPAHRGAFTNLHRKPENARLLPSLGGEKPIFSMKSWISSVDWSCSAQQNPTRSFTPSSSSTVVFVPTRCECAPLDFGSRSSHSISVCLGGTRTQHQPGDLQREFWTHVATVAPHIETTEALSCRLVAGPRTLRC